MINNCQTRAEASEQTFLSSIFNYRKSSIKSHSEFPPERNSFLNNSRQIIDSPKVEHEYHNSISGFQKKSRRPQLLNGPSLKPNSDTDSPKLPPRNKPQSRGGNQMKNNRDKANRKYSDDSLGNQIKLSSSISTEKPSSDPTTIKVTDEEYLLENSWRITDTPG